MTTTNSGQKTFDLVARAEACLYVHCKLFKE